MRRTAALLVLLAACGSRVVMGGVGRAPPPHRPAVELPDPSRGSNSSQIDLDLGGDELLTTHHTQVTSAGQPASGIVISRLPAPHRTAPSVAATPATLDEARALAGHRDPRPSITFALSVAAAVTGAPAPAFHDGAALVAWALEQGAWAAVPGAAIVAGDLVVFDRAVASEPASLIAVALDTDARGVIELLYLARGVVRLGHVDPARPTVARDRDGHAVNSYLRHTSDHPPAGTRYLAGELIRGRLRLSR